MDSFTATTDWATSTDICANDGSDDLVELRNNLSLDAGENYAYLLTDEQDILLEVVLENFYNFEGSGSGVQRVYGIHFDGNLIPAIGENRLMTSASGCFTHSGSDLFLTITKEACEPDFECLDSFTATTDWATSTDICANDGSDDLVELRNNLSLDAGENYAYLLTDEQDILQEIVLENFYNFEGSGSGEQRVYGIHFDGNLLPAIGENRLMTGATGCFTPVSYTHLTLPTKA